MSGAYYNENDRFAAAWLRELIAAGLIAAGDVDERSIVDVQPADLTGFAQCHFFAGIGGWSYALRLAGWPDYRPVWTGSCPCQPFSSAGKGDGADDPRHLWPAWFRLLRECRPDTVFGEQVASADGLGWFDRVSTDLEGEDYAVGAVDYCAAGVGAWHIRQRLWFVAKSATGRQPARQRLNGEPAGLTDAGWRRVPVPRGDPRCGCWDRDAFHRTVGMYPGEVCSNAGRVADSDRHRTRQLLGELRGDEAEHEDRSEDGDHAPVPDGSDGRGLADHHEGRRPILGEARLPVRQSRHDIDRCGATGDMGDPEEHGREGRPLRGDREQAQRITEASPWDAADWIPCRDGKLRPVEPGTFPLAHGLPARVGRLRGYGNAIVPQVAAEFVRAYKEVYR